MSRSVVWLLLFGIALVSVSGCGKEDASKSATAPAVQPADMPPPSPRGPGANPDAATNAAVITSTGDVNATLQQLTQALRDYVVSTRSVPKDFDDFVSKSKVQFPPAPQGQKYAISGQNVVLVKD